MAIYHLSISKNKGSARATYDYNARQKNYRNLHEDHALGYSKNLPEFCNGDPRAFWQACDEHEQGVKSRKMILGLQKELTLEENNQVLSDYLDKLFSDKFVYSVDIHQGENNNLHAHVQVCERELDPTRPEPGKDKGLFFKKGRTRKDGTISGGYRKSQDLREKSWLKNSRELWAEVNNQKFKELGIDQEISDKSLAAQGIDRVPQIHVGPVIRNPDHPRTQRNENIKELNVFIAGREEEKEKLKDYRSWLDQETGEKERLITKETQKLEELQGNIKELQNQNWIDQVLQAFKEPVKDTEERQAEKEKREKERQAKLEKNRARAEKARAERQARREERQAEKERQAEFEKSYKGLETPLEKAQRKIRDAMVKRQAKKNKLNIEYTFAPKGFYDRDLKVEVEETPLEKEQREAREAREARAKIENRRSPRSLERESYQRYEPKIDDDIRKLVESRAKQTRDRDDGLER